MNRKKRPAMKMAQVIRIGVLLFLAMATGAGLHAQAAISLRDAIAGAGQSVEVNVARGSNIAVLNFHSGTVALSRHVVEELVDRLTNSGNFTVVERANLDTIEVEMGIQLSGLVDDEEVQSLGRQLGVRTVISGSLEDTGTEYRFRVHAINVMTARRESSFSVYITRNDPQLRHLLTARPPVASPSPVVQVQPNPAPNPNQPVVAATVPEQPARAETHADAVFRIGDRGPAGGIIFYDKGFFSNGWRFLEAAPVELEFRARWGTRTRHVDTQEAVGSGRGNARVILEQVRLANETGTAAQRAAEINFDGFTDWFIPSRAELDLMYRNLRSRNIGGFSSGRYLSSSQRGRVSVWSVNFSNGRHDDVSKNDAHLVRVIRAF